MNYDAVLLSPPSRSFNHFRPPMALIYLAGYLNHQGLKSKIIDVTEKSVIRNQHFMEHRKEYLAEIKKEILRQVGQTNSNIFGITCYTPEYFEVLDLATEIKKIKPKSKIIVGGIHPTLFPDELLLEPNSPIDFEVIGEGEETLCELVMAIKSNQRNFSTIRSIAFFDRKQKTVVKTKFRPLHDNLDKISYPDYSLIDMDYYTTASPYAIRGVFLRSIYLLATRGCPSTCTFCVAKQLRNYNGGGRYTRIRSAASMLKEIKQLKRKYAIDSFYFIDDLLTINKQNVTKFCQLMIKHKVNLLWGCSVKVNTLNDELLRMMSQAGCIQIDIGIERGSNQALIDIRKGISLKMVEDTFESCRKYGIRTFGNFLVNLPREKKQDLNDVANFAKKLHPDIASINVFIPYPGTDIYDGSKYHFKKEEYPLLTYAPSLIQKFPEKFRFSTHKIDIVAWANQQNRQLNLFWPNFKFHLSARYLKTVLHSKEIKNYFVQFKFLVAEFVNQKFA